MRPDHYKSLIILSFALFILHGPGCDAQQHDSTRVDNVPVSENMLKHTPFKTSIYSILVPGLGQAYNKKYWKIPLVYGGMGVCLYYAVDQNNRFADKKRAYVNRINNDSTDQFLVPGNYYSNESLLKSMDINRRNRDFMLILASAVYILQIVDASVDAHLFYFNVSDDLSLRYSPYFRYAAIENKSLQGLSLTLTF